MEKNFEIKIVRNEEDFQMMKDVRREVFVKEQGIPEEREFDGNDYCSTHLLALVDGKPVGTMRMRYFSDFVKFERMAVLNDYRKTNISNEIMLAGFDFVNDKGYTKVYGVCKEQLLHRWEKNNYHPIDGAPKVEQNGMTLIPIMRELPVNPEAVKMTSRPEILNAKEGTWKQIQSDDTKKQINRNILLIQNKMNRSK